MPALKIFHRILLSTDPFAGDDLHLPCLVLGLLRVLQLFCIFLLMVYLKILTWRGEGSASGMKPQNCGEIDDADSNAREDDGGKSGTSYFESYVTVSFAFIFLDLALLAAIWSAASVGTPTQPHGRDRFLRPLLQFKILFMTAFLIALVVLGILMVHFNRMGDYGCNHDSNSGSLHYDDELRVPVVQFDNSDSEQTDFEDTGWYVLFCIILITQALELIVFLKILSNKVLRWIRKHEGSTEYKVKRGERCLGSFFKCCGILCCFRAGGHELGASMKGELRDAVKVVLDFFNKDGTLNIVFSDVYVALKMLARVQRQRRFECVGRELKLAETLKLETGSGGAAEGNEDNNIIAASSLFIGDTEPEASTLMPMNDKYDADTDDAGSAFAGNDQKEDKPMRSRFAREGSVFALELDGTEPLYRMKSREIISSSTQNDKAIITEAAHFIKHANAIYDYIPEYIVKRENGGCFGFGQLNTFDHTFAQSDDEIVLEEIGFDQTTLVYLQPGNGIAQTPYCILIDDKWRSVIVAIRGTASFEDIVIDLQLTIASMDGVGRKCGFDGTNQFCHKGVLTRCQWLYSDLERHKLLDELLLGEEPRCPGYRLTITGHSLGAGCASVLSMMLRRQFPTLRCYSFCPPGGLITERLAEFCEEFVTSIVNDTDIIPRMSLDNMERLRDEALEILVRIKISKMKMIRILSKKCRDEHLAEQNSKLLHAKHDIPTNTEFYCDLQTFRAVKRAQKECSDVLHVPLYPPGKIVYLVETRRLRIAGSRTSNRNKYTPEWAEKTDFGEILVSRTAVRDHSADTVESNLGDIVASFERGDDDLSDEDEDEDDVCIGDSISEWRPDDYLVLERNFICCSRPQGDAPFIPSILALVAQTLSSLSNNWCAFVSRTTVVTEQGSSTGKLPQHYGLGVSTGLWSYLEKVYDGTGPKDDPDSYVDSGICRNFPQDFTLDSYLTAARTFATTCSVVGFFTLVFLWFSSCVSYRQRTWYFMTCTLLVTSLCQGLVFLVYHSDLCTQLVIEFERGILTADATCNKAWGAKVGIAALVFWFCAAVSAAMCGRYAERSLRLSLKDARELRRRYRKYLLAGRHNMPQE